MADGDKNSILIRLKSLIPPSWFNVTAPIRDMILEGLAESQSINYTLLSQVELQTRISTAQGYILDLIAWDFFKADFLRRKQESDDSWRARIIAELFRERITRKGIKEALINLTGREPKVFAPWNPADCGGGYGVGGIAYGGSNPNAAAVGGYNIYLGGYGIGSDAYFLPSGSDTSFKGAGCYGSLSLPNQLFITAYRPSVPGIPLLTGYGCYAGGYGIGSIAYSDLVQIEGQVLDQEIYDCVAKTVAAGVTPWTAIED